MTQKERDFLEKKVVVSADVAEMLGKDVSQVSRDAQVGRIPSVKKRSGYLFIRSDIESIKRKK